MFKDRLVLTENEILKCKLECADLYKQVAIRGFAMDHTLYDYSLDKLTKLITEKTLLTTLIGEGHE